MWAFYQSSLPVAFWWAGRTDKKKKTSVAPFVPFLLYQPFQCHRVGDRRGITWVRSYERVPCLFVFLGTTLPFCCFGSKVWFKWRCVASQGCQRSSPPHLSLCSRCERIYFVLALNLAGLLHVMGLRNAVPTGSVNAICRWAVRNWGRAYCANYYMYHNLGWGTPWKVLFSTQKGVCFTVWMFFSKKVNASVSNCIYLEKFTAGCMRLSGRNVYKFIRVLLGAKSGQMSSDRVCCLWSRTK